MSADKTQDDEELDLVTESMVVASIIETKRERDAEKEAASIASTSTTRNSRRGDYSFPQNNRDAFFRKLEADCRLKDKLLGGEAKRRVRLTTSDVRPEIAALDDVLEKIIDAEVQRRVAEHELNCVPSEVTAKPKKRTSMSDKELIRHAQKRLSAGSVDVTLEDPLNVGSGCECDPGLISLSALSEVDGSLLLPLKPTLPPLASSTPKQSSNDSIRCAPDSPSPKKARRPARTAKEPSNRAKKLHEAP
ncbi:hypothetical protein L596_021227 [Steinernema carpocapsae]|uniref:Uncharacterized protein n=1 Tax=Steinernema carpocapsae TaxID=34508 RepID=A0A4U5MX08_STECR|nr:hypothetical protein L596_021227 [Steinernema carpocapsae]